MSDPVLCDRSAQASQSADSLARAGALTEANTLLRSILDHTQVNVALLDRELRFVAVNRAYAQADGKTPEDFPGKLHFELYPNLENQMIFERVRDTGEPYQALARPFEYASEPGRGTTYWDWSLVPVRDGSGAVTGVLLSLLDVTERIRAMEAVERRERELELSNREKEVLLREIHHRVKNNLQVVSSLLFLQASRAHDARVAQMADTCRQRVAAIALVHELLYGGDLAAVDLERYTRSLIGALGSAFELPEAVKVEIACEPLPLSLDQAVPCGLLLNELITNAAKHAFVGREGGSIRVCAGESGGQYFIEVADDGVGISSAPAAGTHLGQELIQALAVQLGGSVALTGPPGTRVRVSFPSRRSAPPAPSGGSERPPLRPTERP